MVVRGRLRGRRIELAEAVDQPDGEVVVVVRPVERLDSVGVEDVFTFLRSLPPGTRSKDDIDRQIAEERDSWVDR